MPQCAGVSDMSQQCLNCSVGALNQQTNLPNTELFVRTELSLQTWQCWVTPVFLLVFAFPSIK